MTRYLVVGSPVAHSLSPAMMSAAFAAAGIDASYEAREIPPSDWPSEMDALHDEGIAGVNVTVPHKHGALAGAREGSATASAIGAANTLIRLENGWRADNTDGPGFLAWVEELDAAGLLEREALVLGAGGSARAIVWALRHAGCPRVRLANRTRARAQELASEHVHVEAPGERAPDGGLVVNCTSLGLGADDPAPIDAERLRGAGYYLDLVYPDPPGIRSAAAAGVPSADGLGLLVAQGALSFERWTGVAPDRARMREAAGSELRRRPG